MLLFSPAALAVAETRHILVLSSAQRPVAPQSGFADAVVRELIRSSAEPIQFIEVSVQAERGDELLGSDLAQRIRSAFDAVPPDLVLTIGGPAATAAQQLRRELFAGTPMLIAGVDRRFVEHASFTPNDTVVATEHEPAKMIDEILRLLPDTREVMVIIGASPLEQFWLQQMKQEFRRFGDRVQFDWTNELSFAEIQQRSRTMPPRSAIFFALLTVDGKGEPRVDGDTVESVHAVANAPLFALYGVGNGIIGGPMLSTADLSRTTAQAAVRLLGGESPGGIRTPVQHPGQPTYDARELRRWHIDERSLPPHSVVLFREPSTWERNRGPLTIGAVIAGVPLVTLFLIVSAIRKRAPDRTETGSASAQTELSALSGRLMQERERERSELARKLQDDVAQRMAALTLRLHALDEATGGEEVAEIRATLGRLTGEVAAAPDPIYGRLQALGLAATGRRLCDELAARYGVVIHFEGTNVKREPSFDIAMAMLRVLQEATSNAVVHSQAREVWVSLLGSAVELRLVVRDRGIGFDTRDTAASAAMGLVAIRERLKVIGGCTSITSAPGEGTHLEAWVPIRCEE